MDKRRIHGADAYHSTERDPEDTSESNTGQTGTEHMVAKIRNQISKKIHQDTIPNCLKRTLKP